MNKKVIFILVIFILFTTSIAIEYTCDSCEDCNEKIANAQSGDVVKLTTNIMGSSEETCIDIIAEDFTFDCQNHIIKKEKNSVNSKGIVISRESQTSTLVTIKNCIVGNWANNIRIEHANGNVLKNIKSFFGRAGIAIYESEYNAIEGCEIYDSYDGILISESSKNTIYDSTIRDNDKGVSLKGSSTSDNKVFNNIFRNDINIEIESTVKTNIWNKKLSSKTNIYGGFNSGGNYWSNSDETGYSDTCDDEDKNSICDDSYSLEGGNVDEFPLAQIPSSTPTIVPTSEPTMKPTTTPIPITKVTHTPTETPTPLITDEPVPTKKPTEIPKKKNGVECPENSECISGNCKNKICCLDGKTCCSNNAHCDVDEECDTERFYCIKQIIQTPEPIKDPEPTKKVVKKSENGKSCNDNSGCLSNNCRTGVCCVTGYNCCKNDSDCETSQFCSKQSFYCEDKGGLINLLLAYKELIAFFLAIGAIIGGILKGKSS